MENKLITIDEEIPLSYSDAQHFEDVDYLDTMELLSHLQNPTAGRKVVFSKPTFDGDTTCYVIKVISKNMQDEANYHDSEVFKCHVCSLTVPRKYYREHSQSKIHKSFKKISKKVLQNIFEYHNTNTDIISTRGNTYYCPPCSKTIKIENKNTHIFSKEHYRSLDKENLFNNFVKMFFNDDQDAENSFSIANDEIDSAETRNDHQNAGTHNLYEKNAKENAQNYKQPTTVKTSEIITSDMEKEINDFKLYVKEMFIKYKLNIACCITMDDPLYITAVAPNNNRFKIDVNTFHSFKLSSDFIYCQLCNMSFDFEKRNAHVVTENHVRNIALGIDNMFCRRINNLWIHDLVRNKLVCVGMTTERNNNNPPINLYDSNKNISQTSIVENVYDTPIDEHDTNNKSISLHDTLKNTNPVHDTDKTSNIQIQQKIVRKKFIFCNICNIHVNKKNISTHTNSKSHNDNKNLHAQQTNFVDHDTPSLKVNEKYIPMDNTTFLSYLKNMISKFNLIFKMPTVKDGALLVATCNGLKAEVTVTQFQGFRQTESSVYCQLCQMTISNDTRVHSVTHAHVTHITQRVDDHFCRKINLGKYHCLLCNEIVFDPVEHASCSNKHKNNIQNKLTTDLQKDYDKKRKLRYCDICDLHLTPNCYNEHVNGQRHLKTLKDKSLKDKLSQPSDLQVTVVNKDNVYCKICDREMASISYEDHCKGKKHLMLLGKSKKICNKIVNDRKVVEKFEINKNDSEFLIYLKEMAKKYKINGIMPVVEGDTVVVTTPKGFKEKFPIQTFHSYVRAANSLVCQVCRMNILDKDASAHSQNKLHVTNILQPVDDNFARKINKSWSHCLVCNLTVLNNFDHAVFSHIHKNITKI